MSQYLENRDDDAEHKSEDAIGVEAHPDIEG